MHLAYGGSWRQPPETELRSKPLRRCRLSVLGAEIWGRKKDLGTPGIGGDSFSSAPHGHGIGIPSSWISALVLQAESLEERDRKDIAVRGQRWVTRTTPIHPWISVGNLVLFPGVKVVCGSC